MNPDPGMHRTKLQAPSTPETFSTGPGRTARYSVARQLRQFAAHTHVADVLNATAEVICIVNPDRQVVFLNDEALRTLGIAKPEDVIGRRFGEIAGCIHAPQTAPDGAPAGACSVCGTARAIVDSMKGTNVEEECRIVRTGERDSLDLLVRSVAITIDGQQYFVLTFRDMSDQKRRRALERILFNDVLNAAGSLSGYAELLIDATGRDVDEFRATIHALADEVLDEIHAQQALLMAEHGELHPAIRPLATDHMIRSSVHRFQRTAETQGKSIRIASASDRLIVASDEVLLRRVLGSMIRNAIEATRPGAAITIGCSSIGSRARFWVQNPEVMTPDVQMQIFQRSFSTKGLDRGLGTYSMKLLVEGYLGGQVTFESSADRGTLFCADIPLSPAVN